MKRFVCVFIFIMYNRVLFDYQNGTSRKAKEGELTYGIKEAKDHLIIIISQVIKVKSMLLIKINKKYHDPNCSSVSKMSEQNKRK